MGHSLINLTSTRSSVLYRDAFNPTIQMPRLLGSVVPPQLFPSRQV